MAVYEHTYVPYEGTLLPLWSRWLVIPRNAFSELFRSKLVTAYFVACFVYPLVAAILVYLHHNANALAIFALPLGNLIPIDNRFFRIYLSVQSNFAFILTMFVGPTLVSADLANNALPLYLSRPFSRWQYVAGKMSVLGALLSAVTWVPGLLVFLLQAYLEGWSWAVSNLWIAWALVAGSVTWIIVLSLAALAISALVRWALIARGAMLGMLIVPSAFAGIVNTAFGTTWGNLVSPVALLSSVLAQLFHTTRGGEVPVSAAWIMIGAICGICLLLLSRKVRAYEVIR